MTSGDRRAAQRLKVLRAIQRSPHRYGALRALGMTFSLACLVLIPLSGLARIDLWGGEHRALFRAVPLRVGLAAVIVAVSAMYVVTFLSNVVAGRLFCGWGCPVGQLCRFGERVDTPGLGRRERLRAQARGAAFGLALAPAVLAWCVDLRVLARGSPGAAAGAWTCLGALVLWSFVHGRSWRWGFCQSACPIGVYYSFVSPARWYGVHFRNAAASCIECSACDHVCPVDLRPRELSRPVPARAGVSIADAPGRNHCLECGDCVRACQWMIARKGGGPVPLLLGYFSGPQALEAGTPVSENVDSRLHRSSMPSGGKRPLC